MTFNQANRSFSQRNDIRVWTYGKSPLPDWLQRHAPSPIEPNRTFTIQTEVGRARVHPGNVVVEHGGSLWVRDDEEARGFIKELQLNAEPPAANIGPGKIRRFGTAVKAKSNRSKNNAKSAIGRPRYAAAIGSQPSIEWVQLHRLSVDSAYQRSTENEASRRLIASIASKFDWRLCGPLVVSRRADETLTIIDGQHRWMAARLRDDIAQLPCCIFRYESLQEEARIFILANRARKPMNRLDDYFAALAAADEDALEIQQIVTDAGFKIARNTSSAAWLPGEIAFTSSIAGAIRRVGPEITSAVLTNMATAFPGEKLTHGGAIFGGLVRLMSKSEFNLDPDRLLSALETRTAEEWGKFAVDLKGGDMRAIALHDAILETYERLSHQATASND